MTLKPGVRITGVKPEIVLASLVADGIFQYLGNDFMVTAFVDGSHSAGSLHYAGLAMDVRSKGLDSEKKSLALQMLKDSLGTDFDVLLESPGTPNEHFHIEFQPKTTLTR